MVIDVHTQRGANALEVAATLADLASGIGQVGLSPTVNGQARDNAYMHLVNGDFHSPTDLAAAISSLQPLDRVGVVMTADDTGFNATPPITLPVANTGGDRTVECTSPQGAPVLLDGSLSTGPVDVNVSYLWTGPFGAVSGISPLVQLPMGLSTITLTLTDGRGFTGSETSSIAVVDTTPPSVSCSVRISSLWPPNHDLVNVGLSAVVRDACDLSPAVTVKVFSNEEDNGQPGFDNFSPDAKSIGLGTLRLRSERKAGQCNA